VFLGYSSLHKGFKCLEPKTGRFYISRDVVFDEDVFPFSSLHPNAGARLRDEVSLLPENLNPFVPGVVDCHVPDVTNPTVVTNGDETQESDDVQVIQEIQDDEVMDPAAAVNLSSGSEDAPLTEIASPVEVSSEVAMAFPGSTHGGAGSTSALAPVSRRVDWTGPTPPIAGSSVDDSGSGVADSSEAAQNDDAAGHNPEVSRPQTRLQSGIVKPKIYTDGTVRYANICTSDEPNSVEEALKSSKWKEAMQDEYEAL